MLECPSPSSLPLPFRRSERKTVAASITVRLMIPLSVASTLATPAPESGAGPLYGCRWPAQRRWSPTAPLTEVLPHPCLARRRDPVRRGFQRAPYEIPRAHRRRSAIDSLRDSD